MVRQGKLTAAFFVILLMLLVMAMYASSRRGGGSSGSSGTGFDASGRYPYSGLTEREQQLYQTLYNGIADFKSVITLPDTFTDKEYERVYLLVSMQEPDFFYLSDVYELSPEMTAAQMHYLMGREQAQKMAQELEAASARIVSRLSPAQSEAQKLLLIHDAIASGCTYAQGDMSDNAYGCLVDGYAMCEGYAKALVYVARRAGIEAMCVTGKSLRGVLHVWNIAKLGGNYYNVDVTWDDDDSYMGAVAHTCFAVPDSLFAYDHRTDRNAFIPPACDLSDAGYYHQRGLVLNEPSQLISRLQSWVAQSGGSVVEFQCSNAQCYTSAKYAMQNDPTIRQYLRMSAGGGRYQAIYDDERQAVVVLLL